MEYLVGFEAEDEKGEMMKEACVEDWEMKEVEDKEDFKAEEEMGDMMKEVEDMEEWEMMKEDDIYSCFSINLFMFVLIIFSVFV